MKIEANRVENRQYKALYKKEIRDDGESFAAKLAKREEAIRQKKLEKMAANATPVQGGQTSRSVASQDANFINSMTKEEHSIEAMRLKNSALDLEDAGRFDEADILKAQAKKHQETASNMNAASPEAQQAETEQVDWKDWLAKNYEEVKPSSPSQTTQDLKLAGNKEEYLREPKPFAEEFTSRDTFPDEPFHPGGCFDAARSKEKAKLEETSLDIKNDRIPWEEKPPVIIHRNSLNLQHPQPRPSENQVKNFSQTPGDWNLDSY